MKKIFLFVSVLFLHSILTAQNVGINTPSPTSSLDIDGGLRLRPQTTAVTGTAVQLTSNRVHHILGGSPTGNFNISFIGATENGQHLIITNATLFDGFLLPVNIPSGVTAELIYSNGNWKQIGNNEPTTNTAWGLRGNVGTDTSVNFIGTIDDKPLRIKVNNISAGYIGSTFLSIGYQAGLGNGISNTAIGRSALQRNKSGGNVAVGTSALLSDTTGTSNVAIGNSAMSLRTSGTGNVAIGAGAMLRNKNAYNIAIGPNTLAADTAGNFNIAIGFQSMNLKTGGDNNLGIGRASLLANNGSLNVAIGSLSLSNDTAGFANSAVGYAAMQSRTHGVGNVAMGGFAMQRNKANNNVAIGYYSLNDDSTGSNNVSIGTFALGNSSNSNGSVSIGYQAAFSDTAANGMVAIGRNALYSNNGKANNLAIGDSVLYYNSIGAAFSSQAINNIGIGSKALLDNTTGSNNIAIGKGSLASNTSGQDNTAMGNDALGSNVEGSFNTAVGSNALSRNNSSLSSANVALGNIALLRLVSGQTNTAIGMGALQSNESGSGNVALGYFAGASEVGSNKLYIQNSGSQSDNALIYGDFAADSLLLNAKTVVRNNAVVRGFTKLGGYETDVPSIKMKKMVIPAGPAVNSLTNYPFGSGITDSKVLGIEVLMRYDASTSKIPPGYIDTPGYEYNVQVQFNGITIINKVGNSANIGGRPITVVVTYEE